MEHYEGTNRKKRLKSSNLPRRSTVNEVDIFDKRKIPNKFNTFFTNIKSKLASKIPNASTTFESYINKPDTIMETKQLSMNELKDAFFPLKLTKVPVMMTSVLIFSKNVLVVYTNL